MGRQGYSAEFRGKVLDLRAEGRSVASVAHDLDLSDQTIYNWRRQDQIDRGLQPGLSTTDPQQRSDPLHRSPLRLILRSLRDHPHRPSLQLDRVPLRGATASSLWHENPTNLDSVEAGTHHSDCGRDGVMLGSRVGLVRAQCLAKCR
ncbi:transposase [Janibacter cremeus]|uniref:transposase n=1 Tax=Janibacter cremeus TaxID=1285192 RepID=UPI00163D5385